MRYAVCGNITKILGRAVTDFPSRFRGWCDRLPFMQDTFDIAKRQKALRALSFLLFSLLLASTASAESGATPFSFHDRGWQSCSILKDDAVQELGDEHVVPTNEIDYEKLTPEDALILVHPTTALDIESLTKFMRDGGRVILFDDYGTGDALLAHFGMNRIPLGLTPRESVGGNPALPLAEPASAHPTIHDVTRVVLNHATGIRHPDLSPVLNVKQRDGSETVVAVAGAVQKGRLLIVADASVGIDAMMRFEGNRTFVHGILHYALDDDTWGSRGGKLYLLSGDFAQTGSLDRESPTAKLAQFIRSLHDFQHSANRDGLPPLLAYGCAVIVGILVVGWLARRTGKLHKAVVPRYARPVPLVGQGGAAGHAAVLAAKSTPRALALLEWKSLLEERIKATLETASGTTRQEWWDELEARKVLNPNELARLRGLLLRFSEVETLMISKSRSFGRVSDREVLHTRDTVNALLSIIERTRTEPNLRPTP